VGRSVEDLRDRSAFGHAARVHDDNIVG
jgi:hypothetical protein